jgi:hypothetical protein
MIWIGFCGWAMRMPLTIHLQLGLCLILDSRDDLVNASLIKQLRPSLKPEVVVVLQGAVRGLVSADQLHRDTQAARVLPHDLDELVCSVGAAIQQSEADMPTHDLWGMTDLELPRSILTAVLIDVDHRQRLHQGLLPPMHLFGDSLDEYAEDSPVPPRCS